MPSQKIFLSHHAAVPGVAARAAYTLVAVSFQSLPEALHESVVVVPTVTVQFISPPETAASSLSESITRILNLLYPNETTMVNAARIYWQVNFVVSASFFATTISAQVWTTSASSENVRSTDQQLAKRCKRNCTS